MNKGIVLLVVFLLIFMSFTSISGFQINNKIVNPSGRGSILYVGGSGEGNYTKIQDAIDNASDGDTVFVYDDSSPYNEIVTIGKSINLIGENRNTTIIIGKIFIEEGGDEVNISGFTLEEGIITDNKISGIVISDNHFGEKAGIGFYADNSFIISNTFTNCPLYILYCSSNKISNNIFINTLLDEYNQFTIYCECGGNHVISNNTFINYYEAATILSAIRFNSVDECIIEYNDFNGYGWDAIFLEYSSRNNLISHNTFINNGCGVAIGFYSGFNRVINNTFINNSCGVTFGFFSCFNKIINNNFINNDVDASTLRFTLSIFNIFDSNYWDDWIGLKLPILSFLPYISYDRFNSIPGGFVFDWHPAKESYNYTTTQEYDGLLPLRDTV